jgi:Na+/H+ antiporter NhaD/arsenite permease-like protein
VDFTLTLFVPVIFMAIFLYCLYGVMYRAVKNAMKDAWRDRDDEAVSGLGSSGSDT